MQRRLKHYKQGSKKSQIILAIVLVAVIAISAVLFFLVFEDEPMQKAQDDNIIIEETTTQNEQIISSEEKVDSKELFNKELLQGTVENWSKSTSGIASVVLMDLDNQILASVEKDRTYFAASIYKLFVAHEGYLGVDNGELDGSVDYVNGNSLLECLDLMIRESDSPCAEKLWVELGKYELTKTLEAYGIINTSMTSITTTAQDAALMLVMITNGQEISNQSQAMFLESMRTQIYRDALNSGFSDKVTVYNKIGFRGFDEYHDTAIIEFNDTRLVLSVLTDGVGTRKIADLASDLETILLAN